MIEINLHNAFVVIIKLTWEYGSLSFKSFRDAVCNGAYQAICYLLQKPNITTTIASFLIIVGSTTWIYSVVISLVTVCFILVLLILEGLVFIILVIMIYQSLTIILLLYICFNEFLLSCKII